MNQKIFALALGALLFALCSAAEAQQAKNAYRIGYLSALDPAIESSRAEAIRLALRELGYIDGQNIAIEYRYTRGEVDRASELAAQLISLKVDLIVVAGGDPWIRATKNATNTFPLLWWALGAILSKQA